MAPRLAHNYFFCDYILSIAHHGAYHQALIEWVERYPKRTGRKQDAIASFDLIHIKDTSPPPGQSQPRNVQARTVLSHKF